MTVPATLPETCPAGVARDVAELDLHDTLYASTERENSVRISHALAWVSAQHRAALGRGAD